jgi:hypothetical protein
MQLSLLPCILEGITEHPYLLPLSRPIKQGKPVPLVRHDHTLRLPGRTVPQVKVPLYPGLLSVTSVN